MSKYKEITYKEIESILEYENLGLDKPVGLMKRIYNRYKNDKRYVYEGTAYHGLCGMMHPHSLYTSRYEGVVSYSKELDVALRFASVREFIKSDLNTHIVFRRHGTFFDFSKWVRDTLDLENFHHKILWDRFKGENEVWCIWERNELKNETIETLDWKLLRDLSDKQIIHNVIKGIATEEEMSYTILNVLRWCNRSYKPFISNFINNLYEVCMCYEDLNEMGYFYKGIVLKNEWTRVISNTNRITSYSRLKEVAYNFIADESRGLDKPQTYLVQSKKCRGAKLDVFISKYLIGYDDEEYIGNDFNMLSELDGYLSEEEILAYDDFITLERDEI